MMEKTKNPKIQITRTGTLFLGSDEDLNSLGKEFDQNHFVKLRQFLHPEVLRFVQEEIRKAEFYEKPNSQGLGIDSHMVPNAASELFYFLTSDPVFYQLIERITGCKRIRFLEGGRVYQMLPHRKYYDVWHNDLVGKRKVAMSINLSRRVYSGGVLQIRDCRTNRIVQEIANTGFGDAVIFRLAPHLDHRVLDVEGPVPKTAFVGWFKSEPDHPTYVREKLSKAKKDISLPPLTKITISRNSMVEASQHFYSHDLFDQTLIFNPVSKEHFSLDSVGREVWKLLQQPIKVDKIYEVLLKKYEVETAECERDLLLLLEGLRLKKLVEIKNGLRT